MLSTALCLLQKSLQSLYLQKLELLAQTKADVADLGKEYQLLLDAHIQVNYSLETSCTNFFKHVDNHVVNASCCTLNQVTAECTWCKTYTLT